MAAPAYALDMKWSGAWASGTDYPAGSAVTHHGTAWCALKDNPASEPGTEAADWEKVTQVAHAGAVLTIPEADTNGWDVDLKFSVSQNSRVGTPDETHFVTEVGGLWAFGGPLTVWSPSEDHFGVQVYLWLEWEQDGVVRKTKPVLLDDVISTKYRKILEFNKVIDIPAGVPVRLRGDFNTPAEDSATYPVKSSGVITMGLVYQTS